MNSHVTNFDHELLPIKGTAGSMAVAANTVTDLVAVCPGLDILESTNRISPKHYIRLQADGSAVRWFSDGTDPDADSGFRLAAGESLLLSARQAISMKLFAAAAATINSQVYTI